MKTNKIHIGKIIEEKVKQSSLSVTKFAELINCTNANVYDIFKRPSIDTDLLLAISKILNYNFMKHYSANENTLKFDAEYLLITLLNEDELPETLPKNSVLVKNIRPL